MSRDTARVCAACEEPLVRSDFTRNQWRKGEGVSRCGTCVPDGFASAMSRDTARVCAACEEPLVRSSFTKNQWRKGEGVSRCGTCVLLVDGFAPPSAGCTDSTGRYNKSGGASFSHYDLQNPFAEGSFRWVAKGTYTEGARIGDQCVCKWFKTGGVTEAEFYALDIKAVDKALDLVRMFNERGIIDRHIRLNIPEVWTFVPSAGGSWAGKKVLQEPFIANWEKFNSNTGWNRADTNSWGEVMQALSHFSYHASGGQFVLCDLQGGVYADGVILTDPVILSRTGAYGVTDLGSAGISSFFSRHVCNSYCGHDWTRPREAVEYFAAQKGTTMVASAGAGAGGYHVPTRSSRPQMSAYAGYLDSSSSSSDDY